jgi:mRNA interferase MazF
MPDPKRGEVWIVDLGLIAKIRPCLVLSMPAAAEDRALVTLIPHTTAVRGSNYEAVVTAPFLKAGAFDAQNIVTIPSAKMMRRIGVLSDAALNSVVDVVRKWLGL